MTTLSNPSLEAWRFTTPCCLWWCPLELRASLEGGEWTRCRTNQRRLVSLLDLHRMVTSLGDLSVDPHDHLVSGLLAPVPLNRTCESVEGLKPDALCLCQGWHEWLSSSSLVVVWLAEFALGELNNRIQKQFSASTTGQRRGSWLWRMRQVCR